MREWTLRVGLSLIVTVGIWPDRLLAQTGVPQQPYSQSGLFVVPAVPYEPAYHPAYPAALTPPPEYPPAEHGWRRMLNYHGIGCQADPWGSCGSFHSDFRFIFGSCRDFFGERCVPNPSHGGHNAWRR